MCGRYALITPLDELVIALGENTLLEPTSTSTLAKLPTYNASPGQVLPVVVKNKLRQVRGMKWGLIPNWAPTLASKGNTINAMQETVATKPSFRHLIQTNRCAVPISAFYEWQTIGNIKQPHAIMPTDGPHNGLCYLAGLWDRWIGADGDITETFTVITTNSAGLMLNLHDRQPILLANDQLDHWLDAQTAWPDLEHLLKSYAWPKAEAYAVSTLVNNVKHNNETLLREVPKIGLQGSLF